MSEAAAPYNIDPQTESEERKVPQVRIELEILWDSIQGVEEPNIILEALEQYSGFMVHLQWLEQQLLPLITDLKARIEECKELASSTEKSDALRLNADPNGLPMGKAEKMAFLNCAELRKSVREAVAMRNRYEDEYTDLKGFRVVVQEQMMTLRQKLKMLMEEYKEKPHVRSNP